MADIPDRNYGRGAIVQPVVLVDPVTGNDYAAGGSGGNIAGDGACNTGASTQVASGVGVQTILAANSARYGASVYNSDANDLYLLLGAGTVSSTVFTVKVAANSYYEVPFGFTGVLTGLWAADGSGYAHVTEFS